MVIMNDLEWPVLSYYMIYYEKLKIKLKKKKKGHAANKEWSFKLYYCGSGPDADIAGKVHYADIRRVTRL